MYRAMGLLNLHEKVFSLGDLISMRPLAAIPFGGKYRIVDFALSNMVNSGIYTVGALIPEESSSLLQHLRAGKEWDLDRKQGGLFMLAPLENQNHMQGSGDISYFFQHLDYLLENTKYDYVVLSTSHIICNINYTPVIDYHIKSEADMTLVYYKVPENEPDSRRNVMLTLDENNWVTDVEVDPHTSKSRNRFMWTWILKRELLIKLIDRAYSHGGGDFIRQLQESIAVCKVNAYEFTGYVANVVDIPNYYRSTMALLKEKTWYDLFSPDAPIYTRDRDSQPTKYMKNAEVINSFIANNCRINGHILNSALFHSVVVEKDSIIKDSIVMAGARIGKNVTLENVICDKDVQISDGQVLKGSLEYPLVIKKGTVI